MPRHSHSKSKTLSSCSKVDLNQPSDRYLSSFHSSHDYENEEKALKLYGADHSKHIRRHRDLDEYKKSHSNERQYQKQSMFENRSMQQRRSKIIQAFSGSGSAVSESPRIGETKAHRVALSRAKQSRVNLNDNDPELVSLKPFYHLNEPRAPPSIKILDFHVEIENKPTSIDESSSSVLKYKTPQFKSQATFQISAIDEKQNWKVGWIQACTHMEFFNTYGDHGYTSWEFPEMVTREKALINDSDGRNYPWYGSSHQVVTIHGPTSHSSKYTVTMRDFFHPWIPWDIPTSDEEIPRLTHIYRNQHFLVWLAAMDLESKDIFILRTVQWKKLIEINVDPKRQRGRRSVLVSDPSPVQPTIYSENLPIPTCALYPPTANSAQVLVWRPKSGQPTLVVPPKSIEINTTNYAHLPLARY